MPSLELQIAKVPGLRRLLKWRTSLKIQKFRKSEEQQKAKDPKNLRNFEDKVFSQNGEDGILKEIFRRIGTTDKFFVEFGMEDGDECNGRFLLEKEGWSGLWMDGSPENIDRALKKFSAFPIRGRSAFITRENIAQIFSDENIPKEFDLLVIDIDGNDFWVWETLTSYRPRVAVIEYNARYVPPKTWVMPYAADHVFDGTSHFGASLSSFVTLGKRLEYTLVACDSMGVNAFFVRNDLLNDRFSHVKGGAKYHYVSPKFKSLFFGHPKK